MIALGGQPHSAALAWSGGELTYAELGAMARGAAARLDRLGVGRRERVAVWHAKTPETVALVLGCMLSGRPVLLPPPDLRPDVLDELLAHAAVERLVDPSTDGDADAPVFEAAGTDTALMLTTSGSTGTPKVVPLTHGAIARFASWAGEHFGIGAGTRVLSYCGLNFDLSLLEVWTTLIRGGCAVLVPQERSTHGDHLLDVIRAHEVELVQGVPTLYGLLLDAAAATRLPSVRHAILTGDKVPAPTLERLPPLLPNARLHNVYGCTETNDSFAHEIDVARACELGAVPLGDPLPGVDALVMRDGRVLTGPAVGELWVSTPFQTRGYLGPRAEAGDFVPDPRGNARTFFRSGDVVRREPDGSLFLEGRTDLQVKVRGNRVNLQAVEQVLLEDPDVTEAAVVALDDELAGKRLLAVVRRREGTSLSTLRLRSHCARHLARVAIPSTIKVQEAPLPRTTTGKVDRGAVKRYAKAGTHGDDRHGHAVHS